LIEQNIVNLHDQRFYPVSSKIDFLRLQTPELIHLTKDVCKELQNQAESLVRDKGNLVFYTAFSLQSHQIDKFNEKLREAIYGVIDEFQTDNGDAIQQVFLGSKF